MSRAPNGAYFIVSKTHTHDGKILAATYNGDGNALTVTELKNLQSQVWILAPYTDGKTQTISPQNGIGLVAGTQGSNYVLKPLPPTARHNWIAEGTLGIYTIEDVGNKNFWYIKEAVAGQDISKGQKAGVGLYDWQLILA